jgi:TolB protein
MRLLALAVVLALVMVLSGCGSKQASPPPVGDTIPPSTVRNLEVISPPGPVVTLAWTAPGDDGDVGRAARYDIRRAAAPITATGWDSATTVAAPPVPKLAGEQELLQLSGLPFGTWHFAVRAADEVPNWSAISSSVSASVSDVVPPGRVADLRAAPVSVHSVRLTWTAPGADGAVGTATANDLRSAVEPPTQATWSSATTVTGVPTPSPAGSAESVEVDSLVVGTTYYFALRAVDAHPNWSELSNGASCAMVAVVRLTFSPTGARALVPKWSPDGTQIAFFASWPAGAQNFDIYTIPSSGGAPIRMTSDPARSASQPSWSPDGRKLAFTSRLGLGSTDLCVMDAVPGSAFVTIVSADASQEINSVLNGAFSPDGQRLAYTAYAVEGGSWIYDVPAAGGTPRLLVSGTSSNARPSWSPDGSRIAFDSGRSGDTEIWTCRSDGSDLVRLTTVGGSTPAWSHDGTRIAFARSMGTNSTEIGTMSSDGSNLVHLATGQGKDWSPDWSPDDRAIAFSSDRSGNTEVWILYLE